MPLHYRGATKKYITGSNQNKGVLLRLPKSGHLTAYFEGFCWHWNRIPERRGGVRPSRAS
jgi:hypothetical protein